MTSTFKRIILVGIMFIAIAAGAVALVVTGGCSAASNPMEGMKNGAVNALIDATGIKEKADEELRARAGEIAERLGVPESVVNNIVDEIDLKNWKAATLPDTAKVNGTFDVDVKGTATKITTYDDPGYVSVDVYGQTITMAVPETAQGYVGMASYLKQLQ